MSTLRELLEQEFEYYLAHQDELVREHNDKVIVLKGQAVIGVYDSDLEAVRQTTQEHELGTFLVHRCGPGIANYTHTYHSRVVTA